MPLAEDVKTGNLRGELITAYVNCGNIKNIETSHGTGIIFTRNVVKGDILTIDENSQIDNLVFKRGTTKDVAIGVAMTDGLPMNFQYPTYKKVPILLFGKHYRIKRNNEQNFDWKPQQKIYIAKGGITDKKDLATGETAQDLKFIAMHNSSINQINEYGIVIRQFGDVTIFPRHKNCLDLANMTYHVDEKGYVTVEFEEGSILEQCDFETLDNGNTIMYVPDVAVMDTIHFNNIYEDEGRTYMFWEGCD